MSTRPLFLLPTVVATLALLLPGCGKSDPSSPPDPTQSWRGYSYTVATYDMLGNKGTRDSTIEKAILEDSIAYAGQVGVKRIGTINVTDRSNETYVRSTGDGGFMNYITLDRGLFDWDEEHFRRWVTYPLSAQAGRMLGVYQVYDTFATLQFIEYKQEVIDSIMIHGREQIKAGTESLETIKYSEYLTYHLYYRQSGPGGAWILDGTETPAPSTYWYAPSIGYFAKIEEPDTTGNRRISTLSSYKL
jgi:hypothetical protein